MQGLGFRVWGLGFGVSVGSQQQNKNKQSHLDESEQPLEIMVLGADH